MGLPRTTEEKKHSLVDQVVTRIRDKCPAPQAIPIEAFSREYYRRVGPDDLLDRTLPDLYGAALAHWNLATRRRQGERLIRVYNPRVEEHGWHTTHTIVEIVQDDMPFLVDSVRMELNRQGLTVHLIIHPVMNVRRSAQGALIEVLPEGKEADSSKAEAFLHFEVDRQTDPEMLGALHAGINRVLDDVAAAVEDWPLMREQLHDCIAALTRQPPPVEPSELEETRAFLHWLNEDSFTFLGYREYTLEEQDGEKHLRLVPNSGLGIVREPRQAVLSTSFERLTGELRELAVSPAALILTKGSSRATVHRPGYLDYVGVRVFDASGHVTGERRFLGRYTSGAYTSRPTEIPLLRRKVQQVMQRSQLRPGSHSAKALLNIVETLPRDELFQSSPGELFDIATGILHLQERQQVRVLIRRDPYHRFLSCLVYLPREGFNTDVRLQVQEVMREAFDATHMDFDVSISESQLARLHLIVHVDGTIPDYDVREIEQRIVKETRSWSKELHTALLQELGEEKGNRLYTRYRNAFPSSYCEEYTAPVAVHDILEMEALEGERLAIQLYHPLEAPSGHLRIKLFRQRHPISLSTVLPMLENMGVSVSDERPHEIHPSHRPPIWIHDLGMEFHQNEPVEPDSVRHRFHEAFARVWDGRVENDGFNRLVLHAQCTWRQAVMLRSYCKYLLQTDFPFSQGYMEQVLVSRAQITRMLVDLYRARFDPAGQQTSTERTARLADAIERSLEDIPNLDEDRILRRFYQLIQFTLRTTYYQRGDAGQNHVAFKLDATQVPDIPEPRPRFEIFVYSPRVEAVHLRGGKVARGGIRWSDRPEDFRTEIFGLMKAQMVKNAVIVPVGAKGGFVIKQPPEDPGAMREEIAACYSTFIRGLLDLTDNLAGGRVIPPPQVVRHDDDDPYLVVAADRGTAAFSDLANSIAAEYDFWLGDAFASGGSTGYDHKKMGITARGAWVSVERHFREMGINSQSNDITVVGIGGMNGDVFGNGMLLSRHLRLVAAFSHKSIFLDPHPDPEVSFTERERLFRMAGSWSDYDPQAISEGGGVFSRSAKSVPLSPQVRRLLGIEQAALPPNDVIRAILKTPVDLLWNGGIGTFVKASDESDEEVGDRSNDAIRVNAGALRCRVIGEGGNLGLTQAARIEYARQGGRLNTDFIDNSGGVDCSDHEVNIKILLRGPVSEGGLPVARRNRLLSDMTEEVANTVLCNNYQQAESLSMSEHRAAAHLPEHSAFMRWLEKRNDLDRDTWNLPDDEALEARQLSGEGLVRPELAVLLSYSKIALFDDLLASDISSDPGLTEEFSEYFPEPIIGSYSREIARHPLRPEITATFVANNLINRLGLTAVFRIEELSGSNAPDIARAFMACRKIFDLPDLWQRIASMDNRVEARHQLYLLEEVSKVARRAMLWLLRSRAQPLDVTAAVETYQDSVDTLRDTLPELIDPADHTYLDQRRNELLDRGLSPQDATRFATLPLLLAALDVANVAAHLQLPIERVARLYFALEAMLGMRWLRDHIGALPVEDHWSRLAREALRDELYRLHRTLTVEALETSPGEADTSALVANWMAANTEPLEHFRHRLGQFHTAPTADFALLSVALNELRKLSREHENAFRV
ncbi:NAD-glutamate dehydrogenase [Thiohalomonas denitrificans]|uniref:Glutamate dehydrogenase (NAD) n=1 Tax=Thiohalomonas denitrificans TaxID=415747 RepID=A0A1G5PWY8_9GAMM|nr:NAD-glutamate dehydrogenase [Thiohalomonas denitrificans]SCZ53549.1 glutamate dehydrogenase (NAD) [Thiohalomonas denitrificans]